MNTGRFANRLALIIGASKSGTTSLFEYLTSHPEIARAQLKEPAFFAKESRWNRGPVWYQDLWNYNQNEHRVALEASTAYTMRHRLPETTGRIAEYASELDDLRFIYIVRDPLERILSHYKHGVCSGWFDPPSDGSLHPILPQHLVETSRYAWQLQPYLDEFGPDRLLVVTFQELKLDTASAVARVCRFLELELPAHEIDLETAHNSAEGRRVKAKWWLRLRQTRLGRFVTEYLAMRYVPKPIRHLGLRLLSTGELDREFSFSDEQYQMLVETLRPDAQQLRLLFDIDIAHWSVFEGGS